MANPLVAQGVLNRLKANVNWTGFPALAVTPGYLGKAGITLALEGQTSAQLAAMTGIVQSPEPYMTISVVLHLLKTQALADAYKTQMELNALLGDGVVYPDVSTGLGQYQLANMAIESVGQLDFSGGDPTFPVTCKGIYYVNSAMWD